jgi:putative hydrolase of the HAD superfamily
LAVLGTELGVDAARLRAMWRELEPAWETMPLTASLELLCRELDAENPDIEMLRSLRLAYMRQALRPQQEVIETLGELRRRGLRLGLISACSGDVPEIWGETPFADLIDAPVFSCVVGFCKPDPRIYELATTELCVAARSCLYVGDGGHDELRGATRAGMTAILLHRGNKSGLPRERGWSAQIGSIPEVLTLV